MTIGVINDMVVVMKDTTPRDTIGSPDDEVHRSGKVLDRDLMQINRVPSRARLRLW